MKKKLLFLFVFGFILNQLYSQISTNGLIAYFPFTGNAVDSSGNGHDGVVNGASLAVDRFNNTNSAYYFNGTNNYIELTQVDSFFVNNYSFSYWVNPHSIPASGEYRYPISLGGQSNGDNSMSLNNNSYQGFVGGGYVTGSSTVVVVGSKTQASINTWYHVTLTRDNTSIRLYINGKLVDTASNGGATPNFGTGTQRCIIGGRCTLASQNFFDGDIDDLRLYNRVLDSSEVVSLYNEPKSSPSVSSSNPVDCLIASYSFSGNVNDISGNNYNATVNGATPTVDRFKNANSAYYFDGKNSYIELAPADSFFVNSYSFSYWVNPHSIPASGEYRYPISLGGQMAGDNSMSLNNNSYQGFVGGGYVTGSSSVVVVDSKTQASINTWYHIVLTRDNSMIRLYINGKLIDSASNGGATPNFGTGIKRCIIGGRCTLASQNFFDGDIDDLKMYRCVLDSKEITSLYNEPDTSPKTSRLILTANSSNVSEFGKCNGSANVTVSGGKKPYSYKWNSGETTNSISGKCSNKYSVVVTDSAGVKESANVYISEPADTTIAPNPIPTTPVDTSVTSVDTCLIDYNYPIEIAYISSFKITDSTHVMVDFTIYQNGNKNAFSWVFIFDKTGVILISLQLNCSGTFTKMLKSSIIEDRINIQYADIGKTQVTSNSIDNLEINKLCKIFPNPFANELHVIVSVSSTVKITDINGKEVYCGTIKGASTIETAYLNAGVYFVTVTNEQGSITNKFVKN